MSSGNANVQLGNTIVQANTTTGQVYTNQQGTISYLYGYIDEKTFYGVKKNITFNQFLRNKNDKKLFAPGFHPSALGHELWTNELYNIKYGDISNEYNFWNDIHKNIPFFLYDIKYNNISKNMYSIENEEQEHILININDKYINRDIVLKNLVLTLLEIYNINQIAINIETHGREDITFNNNIYNIFGWFTSYFPYIFNYENINNLHDIFNKDIHKNGIYYLLLKYNYFKNYKLIEEKNKVEILFNYMGDFKSSYSNFKLLDIGEKGDCGHCISFWFSILNDNHDKYLNINISYLRNFIHKQTIINIINKLSHRLLNY